VACSNDIRGSVNVVLEIDLLDLMGKLLGFENLGIPAGVFLVYRNEKESKAVDEVLQELVQLKEDMHETQALFPCWW
jgi:hypothetical protein